MTDDIKNVVIVTLCIKLIERQIMHVVWATYVQYLTIFLLSYNEKRDIREHYDDCKEQLQKKKKKKSPSWTLGSGLVV